MNWKLIIRILILPQHITIFRTDLVPPLHRSGQTPDILQKEAQAIVVHIAVARVQVSIPAYCRRSYANVGPRAKSSMNKLIK